MKQKDIFLQSEGDAWFLRNQPAIDGQVLPDDDVLVKEVLEVVPTRTATGVPLRVLEIGCAGGTRLASIKHHLQAECCGLEPSAKAVDAARRKGLDVRQGTADSLPFEDQSFDIVVFGFCLYLCDRDDLFQIACEGDRVLRSPGWLMIMDFFSPAPASRRYSHHSGIRTHKMDYRTLFTWHPSYECMTHKVRHHEDFRYTDDRDEWVAVSVLRKQVP